MKQESWQEWMGEGDQFFKAGTPKDGKPSKFGPEIRYNVLSMAMEKYIMAIVSYKGTLPENHTYTDLIYALEQVMPVDPDLKETILKYENIQSICSMDERYHREPPSLEGLEELYGAISEINRIAHETCILVA